MATIDRIHSDYWLVRKQVLDVRALFTEGSEYEYTKGYNWRAFIATGLPMLPIFPGSLVEHHTSSQSTLLLNDSLCALE